MQAAQGSSWGFHIFLFFFSPSCSSLVCALASCYICLPMYSGPSIAFLSLLAPTTRSDLQLLSGVGSKSGKNNNGYTAFEYQSGKTRPMTLCSHGILYGRIRKLGLQVFFGYMQLPREDNIIQFLVPQHPKWAYVIRN